ncbi:MAG UNVERIFIED_CONTAM: hypothetical protein LVR18_28345 [Planctomycetaceae bacterium]
MICLSLPCAAADMSAGRLLEWLQSECQRPSVLLEALDLEYQPPSRSRSAGVHYDLSRDN